MTRVLPLRLATAMSTTRPLMLVGPRNCHFKSLKGELARIDTNSSHALRRNAASATTAGAGAVTAALPALADCAVAFGAWAESGLSMASSSAARMASAESDGAARRSERK